MITFKKTFSILFLLLISNATFTAIEKRSDNTAQEQTIEPSDEIKRMLLESALDTVRNHTSQLLFCCQQIEQVLVANKIKINTKKTSKEKILKEIEQFKMLFNNLYHEILKEASLENIYQGTLFNKISIDYLFDVVTQDISTLSFSTFQKIMSAEFQNASDFDPDQILQNNNQKIEELILATDSVGLSSFNKTFKYLKNTPLPYVHTPFFRLIKKTAIYTFSAAMLYTFLIYCLPNNMKIPFTKKTIANLPGATFIGNRNREADISAYSAADPVLPGIGSSATEAVQDNSGFTTGIGNKLERLFGNLGVNLFPGVNYALGGLLLHQFTDIYDYAKVKTKTNWKKFINLCEGKIDNTSTSIFDSNHKRVDFDTDIIGGEALKEIAVELINVIKYPNRYALTGIKPRTGYLLSGPPQTGKSYFAAALRTMINDNFDKNTRECKFLTVTSELLRKYSIETIFSIAHANAPCILFIDEIDMLCANRDKDPFTTSQLLTCMSGLETSSGDNLVIVIGATNRPEALDFALTEDGRFGKTPIEFHYPRYEDRKTYLTREINQKRKLDIPQDFIECIAQETENASFNTLDKLIATAQTQAMKQTRKVTIKDFETSLDREIRHIHEYINVSNEEKEIIATYQAGKALARELLKTEKQVVKATIYPVIKPVKSQEGFIVTQDSSTEKGNNAQYIKHNRPQASELGAVFVKSSKYNDNFTSDQEQHSERLVLLAGHAALELLTNKTFSSFKPEDRAQLIDDLEQSFCHGTKVTNEVRTLALEKKEELYKEIKDLLSDHIDMIISIKNYLVENHTINRDAWQELIQI